MRGRLYEYLVIAFLGLGLLIIPAASRAGEITVDKTDPKIEQKPDQKIQENADWKKEVQPEPKIEDKSIPKTEEKPVMKNVAGPQPKIDDKPNPVTEVKAPLKPEVKSDKKAEGPFQLWKRWDTDTYIELDVIFDRYWGSFNQVVKGSPVGARLRRGGDWKYVAFHFDLAGGYAGSLKSPDVKINDGNLGFASLDFRLNGVLPVLYGVMLQAGIMDETWGEFGEYNTPAQKEANIYIVNGLGPNIMLSFSPIKYVSLNVEYSAILKPIVSKHFFGKSGLNDDPDIKDFSVSDTSYSTVEMGITARPLKYLAIGLAYGEKKMSHQAAYKDKDHPQNNKTLKFKNLNDYIFISLSFTY
jgi:hypothetical protein